MQFALLLPVLTLAVAVLASQSASMEMREPDGNILSVETSTQQAQS